MECPLCQHRAIDAYHSDGRRDYFQCRRCALVFVAPGQRLSPEAEKAEYDRHQNDPYDPGYRRFLSRLFEPLTARLPPPAQGLDFGCGPGPALGTMLSEAGYGVRLYDPFYAPGRGVLQGPFDFITCTEVVEHLFEPGLVLARLLEMLRPGGWLGIMTKLVIDRQAFARWHYKNDPTHVCFFSRETFDWWAAQAGVLHEYRGRDVILVRRPG